MMIYLYSGTPGSGKSLKCAYELIDWLKRGKNVIANFNIDENYFVNKKGRTSQKGKFSYIDNQHLTVKYLNEYSKQYHKPYKEHQTLLIIDECACLFNSRQFSRPDRPQWITFFQQHRKLGYDVILVSQSDRLIDRQIRAFIETEFKHRSIRNYGTFGWLIALITGGFFMQIEVWYGLNEKISSVPFFLNKRKADIYNSFEIFQ